VSQHFSQAASLPEQFSQFLSTDVSRYYCVDPGQHYYHIAPHCFTKAVSWLKEKAPQPVYLLSMVASDERSESGCFRLYSSFLLKAHQILITLVLDVCSENQQASYPALTSLIPSAEWAEREIHDLFGITPAGFDLKPLVLHRDWPRGYYPMRKDFSYDHLPRPNEVPHQFEQPHPYGSHQVAVGPIHAGIIEPGHLRFCATGEQIHQFDAQLFYTHKGIEKMAEGKHYRDVLNLAEHVCGLCSFSHSTAYCQALEHLSGLEVPARAQAIRAICQELERLASHFADLTAICSAGGFGFGSVQAASFRERIMAMNEDLSGSRFLRKLNDIGGLRRDIPDDALRLLTERLKPVETEFRKWQELVLHSDSLLDRLESTGYLSQSQADALGLVGPSARASGIDRDIRRDYPYGAYRQLSVLVPTHKDGDVFARTKVRIEEVLVSFDLIKTLASGIKPGPVYQEVPEGELPKRPAIGLVESAKGELLHWILLDENTKIARWHVRSASYMNWRGVVQATIKNSLGDNNIVPDGPLVNKSFNLCYACTDR
jgi:Ni,Fe-hydrogenase III large subunit/Ni,Fe-hydrogenase III component G